MELDSRWDTWIEGTSSIQVSNTTLGNKSSKIIKNCFCVKFIVKIDVQYTIIESVKVKQYATGEQIYFYTQMAQIQIQLYFSCIISNIPTWF